MVPFTLAPVTVVTGYYGVGKTNFALNLAIDASAAGLEVSLIDLDLVNPYFRSGEYRSLLEEKGVNVIAPIYGEAGTSLDVPSITGAIIPVIEQAYEQPSTVVIIDAGGDDVGATALGRFSHAIEAGPYQMLYVVNAFRPLVDDPTDAVGVMRDIEATSRLEATGIVNNSHLKGETERQTLERGCAFAKEVAHLVSLPLQCSTVPQTFSDGEPPTTLDKACGPLYPIEVYVATPWESWDAGVVPAESVFPPDDLLEA